MRVLLVVVLLVSGVFAQGPAQETTAIVGATVINFDAERVAATPDAVVVMEGERIVAAGPRASVKIPAGAKVVQAQGKWIIPGLIDSHIHFFQSGGLYTRPDALDLRKHRTYEQELKEIRSKFEATLARYVQSGITGVADVGGPMWNFEIRKQAGAARTAPRVAVTGPLISTYQPKELTTEDPPIVLVRTPEEARALVRKQAPLKPDYIKIWYIVERGETAEQHLPIVQATIDESRKHGLRVAVHATELQTARLAVQAGAKILVHSVEDAPVDDAFVALLKKNDVVYIPTLAVAEGYRETFSQQLRFTPFEYAMADAETMGTLFDLRHLPAGDVPERARKMMEKRAPIVPEATLMQNLKRLQDAGVRIAAGSDAGNIGTLHGPSLSREFELMRAAGLTPEQILRSATVGGAHVFGRPKEMGRVAAGALADLVVLDADPLADVRNVERISTVYSRGQAVAPQPDGSPEAVVQRQLNAYNARDLEAFVATYAPDAAIYEFPAKLEGKGHEQIRKMYAKMFAELTGLHAYISRRDVHGQYVVDHEHVTGIPGVKQADAVAIYEVRNGLIQNVWLLYAEEKRKE